MSIIRLFTEHPAAVGETYGKHFVSACAFAFWMLLAGLACFIHAVFPFLFVATASGIIRKLHERMVANRARTTPEQSASRVPAL